MQPKLIVSHRRRPLQAVRDCPVPHDTRRRNLIADLNGIAVELPAKEQCVALLQNVCPILHERPQRMRRPQFKGIAEFEDIGALLSGGMVVGAATQTVVVIGTIEQSIVGIGRNVHAEAPDLQGPPNDQGANHLAGHGGIVACVDPRPDVITQTELRFRGHLPVVRIRAFI